MTRLDLAQDSNRQRIVDTFVNSIYVHEDRAVINLNCCDDEEIVPFEVEFGTIYVSFWNSSDSWQIEVEMMDETNDIEEEESFDMSM